MPDPTTTASAETLASIAAKLRAAKYSGQTPDFYEGLAQEIESVGALAEEPEP